MRNHANASGASAAAFLELSQDTHGDAPHDVARQLYPLSELSRRPWMPRKNGKRIHFSTLLRWALSGKRGIRLRTLNVGGCRCTTDVWAMEFFEGLTSAPRPAPELAPPLRAKQVDRANAQLEAWGL